MRTRASTKRIEVIASASQLAELLPQIEKVGRVAVDTEADSLHCYREKLCLLQVSLPGRDYVVDPLAGLDLAPLCAALERKEIVLHGADFDLRLRTAAPTLLIAFTSIRSKAVRRWFSLLRDSRLTFPSPR